MKSTIFVLCSTVALWAFPFSASLSAADMTSPTDSAFVGKVCQGGMYEVEASKIAEQKATAQDVKDLAIMEIHDHDLVNRELRKIAASEGTEVSLQLKSNSGTAFDTRMVKEFMRCACSISANLRGVLDRRRFDRAECARHRETGTAGGCLYPGDSARRGSAR